MTPEDTLTPSQEATKAQRKLLNAELVGVRRHQELREAQVRCSGLSLEKMKLRDERDKAIAEVEMLRHSSRLAAKRTEEAWASIRSEAPEKAYGGSD